MVCCAMLYTLGVKSLVEHDFEGTCRSVDLKIFTWLCNVRAGHHYLPSTTDSVMYIKLHSVFIASDARGELEETRGVCAEARADEKR